MKDQEKCKKCGGTKTLFTPKKNRPYYGCKACQAKNLDKYRYCTIGGRTTCLFASAKYRARRIEVEFDLDRVWIEQKILAGCELTGINFHIGVNETGGITHPYAPSIDRITAGGPYTQDNCRMVLMMVNSALNAWGEDAFSVVAQAYVLRNTK